MTTPRPTASERRSPPRSPTSLDSGTPLPPDHRLPPGKPARPIFGPTTSHDPETCTRTSCSPARSGQQADSACSPTRPASSTTPSAHRRRHPLSTTTPQTNFAAPPAKPAPPQKTAPAANNEHGWTRTLARRGGRRDDPRPHRDPRPAPVLEALAQRETPNDRQRVGRADPAPIGNRLNRSGRRLRQDRQHLVEGGR